ncbi:unnamed protein product [Medioppia subpectinata]|uniref:Uncharacterized protein n=1 Tax=Medioppia subpectinata TaxID=1979941 RepID=A0A7R9KW06_9ACAR|nr:unnamed protein product [Medioppia subpectinata]CAG2110522.1 unnamed protein product [Medioppia subpectinata]
MEGTSDLVDAIDITLAAGQASAAIGVINIAINSADYDMKHRNRGCEPREGTKEDVDRIVRCFQRLQFVVEVVKDGTLQTIETKMQQVSDADHSDSDCVVVVVLTHGDGQSLWARNVKYPTETLFEYFNGNRCPTLIGKPKIFIIQACRGVKVDPGSTLKALGPTPAPTSTPTTPRRIYTIPTNADFLVYYSTSPGTSDLVDAIDITLAAGQASAAIGVINIAINSADYDMKHRNRGCEPREGTKEDVDRIVRCFQRLQFVVEVVKDGTLQTIETKMQQVSDADHSDSDCVVVVVLTHGDGQSLWARNVKYPTETLFEYFNGNRCPTLIGKPKIFIIQACRGVKVDPGSTLKALGPTPAPTSTPTTPRRIYTIPTNADFLVYYSTSPAHLINAHEINILQTKTVKNVSYDMKHQNRGKCVVFNHRKFDKSDVKPRPGTDRDAEDVIKCFKRLQFDVICVNDGTFRDIKQTMTKMATEDHSDSDCVVVVVLTHGDEQSLWARNAKYPIDTLFAYFTGDRCPTLVGKPKIFIIQACRGEGIDSGIKMKTLGVDEVDSNHEIVYKIPTIADFLVYYSTAPGHFSFRNVETGSVFIQELVVAYYFESYSPDKKAYHKKKQIPLLSAKQFLQFLKNGMSLFVAINELFA